MKKTWILGSVVLALCTVAPGCSWFKSNGAIVATDVGQVAACVIGEAVAGGVIDPLAIVAACGPIAVADIEQIVASLVQSLAAKDAGSPGQIASLVKLQSACHALVTDAGGK